MGLAMTKEIGKGKALILHGSGSNGKSIYGDICAKLVGEDNYVAVSLADLSKFGTARIQGKRLVLLSEIDRATTRSLMTNELKQIITGERMQAQEKYVPIFNMRPFAKVLILTNHTVGFMYDDTNGAIRRLLIVPFEYHVSPREMDVDLESKLCGEISGIFNLAVEAYQRLKENNYEYSFQSESDRIVQALLCNENPMREFVREELTLSHGNHILYEELKIMYQAWCDRNEISVDITAIRSEMLFNEVSKAFPTAARYKTNGKRGIKNIGISK